MKAFRLSRIEIILFLGVALIGGALGFLWIQRNQIAATPHKAAYELSRKIHEARAHATAKHVDVAVVFPLSEVGNDSPLAYRAYRVCEVESVKNGEFLFKRWCLDDDWQYLPKGTVIGRDKNNSRDELFCRPEADSGEQKASALPANRAVSGITSLNPAFTNKAMNNCIVIRSDGMLHKMEAVLIRMRRGTVDANGNVVLKANDSGYLPVAVRFHGAVKVFHEFVTEK